MTVPEENRPKTKTTDPVLQSQDEQERRPHDRGATGRTMREAMEEAGLRPEDTEDNA